MVDSPKQLTVTMFFIIVMQLLELQIPILVHLVLETELETNLVQLRFSFVIQFAIFEGYTLRLDPSAQFCVFLVLMWHITFNSGRDT
jgi:hypothetical protein